MTRSPCDTVQSPSPFAPIRGRFAHQCGKVRHKYRTEPTPVVTNCYFPRQNWGAHRVVDIPATHIFHGQGMTRTDGYQDTPQRYAPLCTTISQGLSSKIATKRTYNASLYDIPMCCRCRRTGELPMAVHLRCKLERAARASERRRQRYAFGGLPPPDNDGTNMVHTHRRNHPTAHRNTWQWRNDSSSGSVVVDSCVHCIISSWFS